MRTNPALILFCSTQIMYELWEQNQDCGTESNGTGTRTLRQSLTGLGLRLGLGGRVWQLVPWDITIK